ncbi:MAG TPA: hypothetical protein VEK08_24645 [Planctomycetota bacterium]|nr:hypothetical protein [Planctomycetota bacterium]
MPAAKRLQKIVDVLAKRYEVDGKKGELTEVRDPFQLGTWYILGQHAKRNGQVRAFDALRRAKGVTPGQLLDILPEKLATICQTAGPYEDARGKNLYAYADSIEEKCGQDFAKIFKKPLPEARKFLENDLRMPRQFADFLLMYTGAAVFAVDLRVARVASRLGLGKIKSEKELDEKSYAAIQKSLEAECPKDPEFMIRAHGLLYRHGADVCHSSAPNCEACPLVKECLYVKKHPIVPKDPALEVKRWSRQG